MLSASAEIGWMVHATEIASTVEGFSRSCCQTYAAWQENESTPTMYSVSKGDQHTTSSDQKLEVQDCPIDRLLRAMASDKQNPLSPNSVIAVESSRERSEGVTHIPSDLQSAQNICFTAGEAMHEELKSPVEGETRVVCLATPDAKNFWIGQLSPARVSRVAAAPLGLEALACTAAEILTRSCRPPPGLPVSPSTSLSVLHTAAGAVAARAAAAAAVAALAGGSDEDTDCSTNTRGRWERGDAQLSALSTPPFSPDVAAFSGGLMTPDPPPSLTV